MLGGKYYCCCYICVNVKHYYIWSCYYIQYIIKINNASSTIVDRTIVNEAAWAPAHKKKLKLHFKYHCTNKFKFKQFTRASESSNLISSNPIPWKDIFPDFINQSKSQVSKRTKYVLSGEMDFQFNITHAECSNICKCMFICSRLLLQESQLQIGLSCYMVSNKLNYINRIFFSDCWKEGKEKNSIYFRSIFNFSLPLLILKLYQLI